MNLSKLFKKTKNFRVKNHIAKRMPLDKKGVLKKISDNPKVMVGDKVIEIARDDSEEDKNSLI